LQIRQTLAETRICLIKDGLPANDIRVDGSKVKKFYFMSLHTRGNAILDGITIEDIVNNGECLLVNLTCRDARGELYTTKFDIDFRRIGSENIDITYQYDDHSLPVKTGCLTEIIPPLSQRDSLLSD
jgi:hypothetical protein